MENLEKTLENKPKYRERTISEKIWYCEDKAELTGWGTLFSGIYLVVYPMVLGGVLLDNPDKSILQTLGLLSLGMVSSAFLTAYLSDRIKLYSAKIEELQGKELDKFRKKFASEIKIPEIRDYSVF